MIVCKPMCLKSRREISVTLSISFTFMFHVIRKEEFDLFMNFDLCRSLVPSPLPVLMFERPVERSLCGCLFFFFSIKMHFGFL